MTAEHQKSTDSHAGRVIVLDIIGLQPEHLAAGHAPNLAKFLDDSRTAALQPPFPAVTVPAQTTLASGTAPSTHGDVANGEYDREHEKVAFWERDRAERNRLWETASDVADLTTGALFFQHLIGTTADVAVTPSPIEDENNNMLEMNCWTNPDGFYDELREEHGHFPLHNYWSPMANIESSDWILTAARESISRYDPDLLWVYVPHLDYDAQRHGPRADETLASVSEIDTRIGEFLDWLRSTDSDRWDETVINVVSEYGFHDVDTPVFPNRALRDADLLATQGDGDEGEEVDLKHSRAFAMVDHQIAHVYTESPTAARRVLEDLQGVDTVLDKDKGDYAAYGIDHPNAGELVLIAEPNAWFQYYWWYDHDVAPYYAADMDIHAKPGFDPCELFLGEKGLASLNPAKVSGSHGRVDGVETSGIYGLGGPAAQSIKLGGKMASNPGHRADVNGNGDIEVDLVDARAVAPTIVDLLGIADTLEDAAVTFEGDSLLNLD